MKAAGRFPAAIVLAATVVGVALRLAFSLGHWVGQPLARDEIEYLSLARGIASGRGYTFDSAVAAKEPFGRAPGYPAWLAITGPGPADATSVPTSIKVVQSLTSSIGIFLLALVAWRLTGAGAARVAAILAAIYPSLVWMPAFALSEALFWPLALAAAWTLDRATNEPQPRHSHALVAGLAFGVAALFRAATVVTIGLTVLWLLWRHRRVVPGFLVGVVLVIAPWTVRNVDHYGRFVLIATDGGVTFWTGNNAIASGEGDMASNPPLAVANKALRAAHPDLDEEAMEPVYYREAMSWIRAHPIDWLELEVKKCFYLIVPIGPSYWKSHSRLYAMASIVPYVLVLPFVLLGAARLRGRWHLAPGLWLLALSVIAVSLIFFPQERFRFPILDSALIVCASVSLGRWWEQRT